VVLAETWQERTSSIPVKGHNYVVQGEASVMSLVLAPDGSASELVISWGVEGVVEGGDERGKVRDNCKDLICNYGLSPMSVPLREWVYCGETMSGTFFYRGV